MFISLRRCLYNVLPFLLFVLILSFATQTKASPGDFDTDFNTNGYATVTSATFSSLNSYQLGPSLIALQSNGKIVVAFNAVGGTSPLPMALTRFNTDGTIDTTFGTSGVVISDLGNTNPEITALALEQDDSILIAGGFGNGGAIGAFIGHYSASGAIDGSFGGSDIGGFSVTGFRTVGTSGGIIEIVGMGVDADGIITVGVSSNYSNMVVQRYVTSTGTLDSTFGTSGTAPIETGFSPEALILQSDKKIVVEGQNNNSNPATLSLFRYTENGSSLDSSFGTMGQVSLLIPTTCVSYCGPSIRESNLTISSEGAIALSGVNNDQSDPTGTLFVIEVDSTGNLVSGFGTSGVYSVSSSTYQSQIGITFDPSGNLLIAGIIDPSDSNMQVGLLDSSATLVSSFGEGVIPGITAIDEASSWNMSDTSLGVDIIYNNSNATVDALGSLNSDGFVLMQLGDPPTYTVGGSISGLSGSVVLQDNAGNNLTVSSSGSFTFSTGLVNTAAYDVTVLTQPTGQTCNVTSGSGSISGANVTNVSVSCTTNTYTVGGSISGLTGTVVLQDNGGDSKTISSNGSFTFATALADSFTYAVTVLTQPTGQTCNVTSGSGIISGTNVTNVSVSCTTNTYTVGGSISGLTGTVVLQDNGGDSKTISSNGSFTFATPVNYNSSYVVTVLTQPTGQTCNVTSGSGTISGTNVTNVSVSCTTNTYTVGGSISGLTGTVVLQDNGGDSKTILSNGSFTFATPVNYNSSYVVTILTQPAEQTCSVSSGNGSVSGAVTNVSVVCSTDTYTVGGSISGLSGSVVLQDNAGDNLTVSSDGSFTFATAVADTSAYAVTILTQPSGQACTLTNDSGTLSGANISNVSISCETDSGSTGGGSGSTTGGGSCTPSYSITVTSPSGAILVGSDVTYTIDVSNTSDCDATDSSLNITLSSNQAFLSAGLLKDEVLAELDDSIKTSSTSSVTCSGTSTVNCDLSTIAANSSTTVNIISRVTAPGDLSLISKVSNQASTAQAQSTATAQESAVIPSASADNVGGCSLNVSLNETQNYNMTYLLMMFFILPLVILRFKKSFNLSRIKSLTFALVVFTSLVGVLSVVLVSSQAQAATSHFSLVPQFASEASDYVFTYGSPTLQAKNWEFSQFLDYGFHPLEIDVNGKRIAGVSDDLLIQQLGLGYGITDKLTVEGFLPIAWWNRFTPPGTTTASNIVRLGDLDIQARYSLKNRNEDSFGLAFIPYLTLPTGSDHTYVGDHLPTGGLRVALDKNLGDRFSAGLNAGIKFRQTVIFDDLNQTSQFELGAGASAKIIENLSGKAEVASATSFNNFYQKKVSSPTQANFALNEYFPKAGINLSVGSGISLVRGAGVPLFNTFLGLSYTGRVSLPKSSPREVALRKSESTSKEWNIYFKKENPNLTDQSKGQLDVLVSQYASLKNTTIILKGDAYGKHANKLTQPLFRKRVKNIEDYLSENGLKSAHYVTSSRNRGNIKTLNFKEIVITVQ